MSPLEHHAVGQHKISATLIRKSPGDLLVSQHVIERWYETEDQAAAAFREILVAFTESNHQRFSVVPAVPVVPAATVTHDADAPPVAPAAVAVPEPREGETRPEPDEGA